MAQHSFLKNRSVILKTALKRVTDYLLRKVYPHIHDVFAVLRFVWFHVLMLCVGYFTLTFTDQARDMLYVLAEALEGGFTAITDTQNLFLVTSFFLGILWWSFVMWFTSRMILKAGNIRLLVYHTQEKDGVNQRVASVYIRFFIRQFPRVCGSLPFLFVMAGAWQLNRGTGFTVVLFGLLFILAIAVYSLRTRIQAWLATRRMLIKLLGNARAEKLNADPHRFDPRHQSLRRGGRWVAVMAVVLTIGLFVWLSVNKTAAFAQRIGPHGLILSALGSWTVFGSMLVVFSTRLRIPGFLLLILYVLVVSNFNNNHSVRTSPDQARVNTRPGLTPQIAGWMRSRISLHPSADSVAADTSVIPIVVVAAQGGGIRAMSWTARVMQHLSYQPELPGFYDHVFAVSGVSGGSVGLAVHTAFMSNGACPDSALGKMVSADYLSPVTAGLLYPDFFQKFLWWKVETFDRARRLEDAWAERYQETIAVSPGAKNMLNNDFLSLWDNGRYRLPAIFLNSVLAENGQKAIFSNIRLDSIYFPDAIDVIHQTRHDFPLKSAALCSARFPYVTPGGLVRFTDGTGGHLIDGGYLENTGLVTALAVVSAINDYINGIATIPNDPLTAQQRKRFKPVLLFIQNADFSSKQVYPIQTMHELLVPLSGFISSWDRAGVALDRQMDFITEKFSPEVTYVKFELDRKGLAIPLSWYISVNADREINDQAKMLRQSKLTGNVKSFHSLCEIFAPLLRVHR
jgi:hypothetical protein